MKNLILATLLFALGCQAQDSASREAQTLQLPSASAPQAVVTASSVPGGGVGDAASLAPAPAPSETSSGSSLALVDSAVKSAHAPKEPSPPTGKTCSPKPPGGPCAGAIGFCPQWKCVEGTWVDQRPKKKGPGAPGDPLGGGL